MSEAIKPRPVIDVENLEIWPSVNACARALCVKPQYISKAIFLAYRVSRGVKRTRKGRRLEYLDYWLSAYTPAEKEKHARQNGFYFM